MNSGDDMSKDRILVWLPSPLGDVVMCTPALRAIRENMPEKDIFFLGSHAVRQTLSPTDLADEWIELDGSLLKKASTLRLMNFEAVILFKNSFSCALTVYLAGIKNRIGYYRDCRSLLLTNGMKPVKEHGKFKPAPMMDYYLNLLGCMGIVTDDKQLSLEIDSDESHELDKKLPQLHDSLSPIITLVPGGAFGSSKCWPVEHYAAVADYLVIRYDAQVVVSVAPNESHISDRICELAQSKLINLAKHPLSLGQLKALITKADLVIANDTGPRHIAIALNRAVITMFGPNDPKWTDSRHPLEEQIVTKEFCAPCQKPECPNGDPKCMRNITVESVCAAADKLLGQAVQDDR